MSLYARWQRGCCNVGQDIGEVKNRLYNLHSVGIEAGRSPPVFTTCAPLGRADHMVGIHLTPLQRVTSWHDNHRLSKQSFQSAEALNEIAEKYKKKLPAKVHYSWFKSSGLSASLGMVVLSQTSTKLYNTVRGSLARYNPDFGLLVSYRRSFLSRPPFFFLRPRKMAIVALQYCTSKPAGPWIRGSRALPAHDLTGRGNDLCCSPNPPQSFKISAWPNGDHNLPDA